MLTGQGLGRQLLQVGRDVGESGRQAGAHRRHARDDHNRDQRGDQAILNGRRAAFVIPEILEIHNQPHVERTACWQAKIFRRVTPIAKPAELWCLIPV